LGILYDGDGAVDNYKGNGVYVGVWGNLYLSMAQKGIEVLSAKSARQANNKVTAYKNVNDMYKGDYE
jgi:hypothetical protein